MGDYKFGLGEDVLCGECSIDENGRTTYSSNYDSRIVNLTCRYHDNGKPKVLEANVKVNRADEVWDDGEGKLISKERMELLLKAMLRGMSNADI